MGVYIDFSKNPKIPQNPKNNPGAVPGGVPGVGPWGGVPFWGGSRVRVPGVPVRGGPGEPWGNPGEPWGGPNRHFMGLTL